MSKSIKQGKNYFLGEICLHFLQQHSNWRDAIEKHKKLEAQLAKIDDYSWAEGYEPLDIYWKIAGGILDNFSYILVLCY
jgi:hypothetical protein